MTRPAGRTEFEHALAAEIIASEAIRVRVLAATLAILLAVDLLVIAVAFGAIEQLASKPIAWWLPASWPPSARRWPTATPR
jgi:hypothetical protein